jgi:hypothetical protein
MGEISKSSSHTQRKKKIIIKSNYESVENAENVDNNIQQTSVKIVMRSKNKKYMDKIIEPQIEKNIQNIDIKNSLLKSTDEVSSKHNNKEEIIINNSDVKPINNIKNEQVIGITGKLKKKDIINNKNNDIKKFSEKIIESIKSTIDITIHKIVTKCVKKSLKKYKNIFQQIECENTKKILAEKNKEKKEIIKSITQNDPVKHTFTTCVLPQLLSEIPKDKKRLVCKNCNELGHSVASTTCKINIEKNNRLQNEIKNFLILQDPLNGKTIYDYCEELSEKFKISQNMCKQIYYSIPKIELLKRDFNIDSFLNNLDIKSCGECNVKIYNRYAKKYRVWKNDIILCDTCWGKQEYKNIRDNLWKEIEKLQPSNCEICGCLNNKKNRFQYDHINMYSKSYTIFKMIDQGMDIKLIYDELDKCQYICCSCHDKITEIENRIGFTSLKFNMKINLSHGKITQDEYDKQIESYKKIYEEKMAIVYKQLKTHYSVKLLKK